MAFVILLNILEYVLWIALIMVNVEMVFVIYKKLNSVVLEIVT